MRKVFIVAHTKNSRFKYENGPCKYWRFGFSLYKNIFLVLVPANIEYLVLVIDILF